MIRERLRNMTTVQPGFGADAGPGEHPETDARLDSHMTTTSSGDSNTDGSGISRRTKLIAGTVAVGVLIMAGD